MEVVMVIGFLVWIIANAIGVFLLIKALIQKQSKKNATISFIIGLIGFTLMMISGSIVNNKKTNTMNQQETVQSNTDSSRLFLKETMSEPETDDVVEHETITETETIQDTEKEIPETEKIAETEIATDSPIEIFETEKESGANRDNVFSVLSDNQFDQLTEMIAKSFYTESLEETDHQLVEADSMLQASLETVFEYSYDNNLELPAEYEDEFTKRYQEKEVPCSDLLNERFILGMTYNPESGEWTRGIQSYTLAPEDVITENNRKYVDAEGYLDIGVVVYSYDDNDELVKTAEITDIAYNQEIEQVCYPYAINVKFYDDPEFDGWRDGESFLRTNKELSGKPLYYVDILDPNRSIDREVIDYAGNFRWDPLYSDNAEAGEEVYLGERGTKAFQFTIVSVDKDNDQMIVQFPSGSTEEKSLSAMISKGALFLRMQDHVYLEEEIPEGHKRG